MSRGVNWDHWSAIDFEHPLATLAHCCGPGSTAAFWLRLRRTWSRASTAEVLRLRAAAIENIGRPDPCISIDDRPPLTMACSCLLPISIVALLSRA